MTQQPISHANDPSLNIVVCQGMQVLSLLVDVG